MKRTDIERMISLADDRYIDEIFQDKITGRRKNIFVTFTAAAAALALAIAGIGYLVSNAGNADKIVADDHIVSEWGIVDYSLYFQNKDMSAMEVEGDSGVLSNATGISCSFWDSEYVSGRDYLRSVMPFDMSGYISADCQFFYNYKDEVIGIMLYADDRTDAYQENFKYLNVEAYEQGELFPHIALGKIKSMKRFDVDVYGFDFRESGGIAGLIFASGGKEYIVSGSNISYDEIGIIMDSIIENGLWTDRFDLSKAEIKYGDISADITLEEANMIKPFAGYVPLMFQFGDMTLNDNKVSYSAGRDENNGIVPEWLYFTYFNGSDKDICLQYFTDSADVKPLGDTVPIDDIDLDKLSEFRHGGNNPTFTIDFGGFKVNVWANCCTDSELLSFITAMRTGASSVVSSSSEEISLAAAREIEPYGEYVPKNDSIGDMRVTSVYYDVSTYIGGEDTAVLVNFMDSRDNHIMLHYGNFKEKVRDKYVPLDEVYDRLESFSEQSEYYADCRFYSFTIDCGDFWIKVSADCTPEEMEQCIMEINYREYKDVTLAEANKIEPYTGFVPQAEKVGDMKLGLVLYNGRNIVLDYSIQGGNRFAFIGLTYTTDDITQQYGVIKLAQLTEGDVEFQRSDSDDDRHNYALAVDCGGFYVCIDGQRCTTGELYDCILTLLMEKGGNGIDERNGVHETDSVSTTVTIKKEDDEQVSVYDAEDEDEKILTIDKVKELAKKGEDLTWSDFDGYTFTEGGSGLYIKSYAVEGGYNLMIGGEGRETKPAYIYLSDGKGKRVDIRYYSIDDFLNKKMLTIDKIKELAKKGDDLTWSDFDGYLFSEGGSGLYIRMYPVEDGYTLAIGGVPNDKPMYINLGDNEKHIDIRYDSVDDFLNEKPFMYFDF